jgi:hypothetical protein
MYAASRRRSAPKRDEAFTLGHPSSHCPNCAERSSLLQPCHTRVPLNLRCKRTKTLRALAGRQWPVVSRPEGLLYREVVHVCGEKHQDVEDLVARSNEVKSTLSEAFRDSFSASRGRQSFSGMYGNR